MYFMRRNIFAAPLLALVILAGCKKTSQQREESTAALSSKNAASALPHSKQYGSEVASGWMALLAHITRVTPLAPPPTARLFAYSGLTLYESVVPGMPSYQSMYQQITGHSISIDKKKDYYWPEVANAAMARITSRILGTYSATPNLFPVQSLEANFEAGFTGKITAEQMALSKSFGQSVADEIFSWSMTDGTFTPAGTLAPCPPYVPSGLPGKWVPTPPLFLPAAGACQGNLRTFIPGIVSTVLAPPPPAYSTVPGSPFYQMNAEVYAISLTKTANDDLNSQAWRDLVGTNYNTPSHIFRITARIIEKEGLNLEEAAVLFAKQGMANSDAIGAAFYSKFYYAVIRPITYIRGVMGYSNWNSLYNTVQHPSYPAVAPAAAGSMVEILENQFGENYAFSDTTQQSLYGTWNYNSFQEMLNDVGRSRTHSALNYVLSVSEGAKQGRKVGQMIENLPFKKP